MRAAIDDTIAGEEGQSLPQGWSLVPIASVARLRSEKANPREHGILPFVGMDDIESDGLTITRTRPFSEMRSAGNRFYPGDLLYGRLRPYLNKTAVVRSDGACSGELLVIEPSPAIDVRYLQYFMHSRRFVSWVSSVTSGDRPRISFVTAASFHIPLAPLLEQKRIVARIDALFAEIDEGEAALAQARQGLETFRRALLKSAVTGELTYDWRPTNTSKSGGSDILIDAVLDRAFDEEFPASPRRKKKGTISAIREVYSLPTSWQWTRLGDIGEVSGGLTKNQERDKMPMKAPYLRVANVQMGSLDLVEIKEIGVTANDIDRALLKEGDLLIVEGNGSIDQIGRCAVWRSEIKGCVHQNHIIKARFNRSLLSSWCLHWLQSPLGRAEIEKVAASTSGLHTLSISKIQALPVPVPPAAEIEEIIRRIDNGLVAYTDTSSALNLETGDAARLRQAILKSAFEGRLVFQDAADEPVCSMVSELQGETASQLTPQPKRAGEKR